MEYILLLIKKKQVENQKFSIYICIVTNFFIILGGFLW